MKRYGAVIQIRAEKLEEYKQLHSRAWPQVLAKIKEVGIRNYSIFYRDGLLFSYYEYVGEDYAADMQKMADDPWTQKWWALTDPCQTPVETAEPGQWWAPMSEVFYTD